MLHSSIDIIAADGDTLLLSALSEISEECGKARPSTGCFQRGDRRRPSCGGVA